MKNRKVTVKREYKKKSPAAPKGKLTADKDIAKKQSIMVDYDEIMAQVDNFIAVFNFIFYNTLMEEFKLTEEQVVEFAGKVENAMEEERIRQEGSSGE